MSPRHALAAFAVLLALALIVGATHELAAHVLPFDWSTAGADVAPAPVSVQLP